MPPYPSCITLFHIPPATLQPLQFCSTHPPVPTDPSQIPRVINICSAFPPAPLSHITHLFSFYKIILISTYPPNPAKPVLSLNSSLTTSWPCTDLKYLSTPAPFLYHLLLPVLLISHLNLPFSYALTRTHYPAHTSSSKPHIDPTR